jgi:hypothetical protein
MNTKTTLTCLTASIGLLAFTLPKDEIKFSVNEGTSLTKNFEITVEASLDDLLLNFNGQEIDPAAMGSEFDLADANGSFGYVLSVVDDYVKMDGARTMELHRQVDTMAGEYSAGTGDSGSESAPIEGHTLIFKWDAEEEEYTISEEDKENAVEAEDTELFAEDLDLRSLLPNESVSEGDSWTLSGSDLMSILAPGLDVRKALDKAKEEASEGEMPIEIDEALDMISEDMVLECTYVGTRDVEGRTLLVIELSSEFESNIDLSDIILEAIEANMPPEMALDLSVVLEMAAEATGEVTWDARAGHFVNIALEIDIVSVIDASGSMDAGGQEMSGGIEAEASLHYELSASAN